MTDNLDDFILYVDHINVILYPPRSEIKFAPIGSILPRMELLLSGLGEPFRNKIFEDDEDEKDQILLIFSIPENVTRSRIIFRKISHTGV